MEPLVLDPDDPLGSVLAWLAALARALGLDAARGGPKVELNRASAAKVRRILGDWSRQLQLAIRAEAARRAAGMRLTSPLSLASLDSSPARGGAKRSLPFLPRVRGRWLSAATPEGGRQTLRVFAVDPSQRRRPGQRRSASGPRRDPAALIGPAEDAALRRRTRAVLLALHDPCDAIARLAAVLAQRQARLLARAEAAHAVRRERLHNLILGRRRFPHPPRIVGLPARRWAQAPEPRPPDR